MDEDARNTEFQDLGDLTYRIMFDLANDGLLILNLNGYIKDLNRTAYQRLGFTKEELLGRHVSELNSPEFVDLVPRRLKEIVERGHTVVETANVHKDGTVMPIEVSATLIELDGERCIFSVLRDISERKVPLARQHRQRSRPARSGTGGSVSLLYSLFQWRLSGSGG